MATIVRRTTLTLPAAPPGPGSPLPDLGALPVRRRPDRHTSLPSPVALDAIVVESDRLRAIVLPTLGGRLHSLSHKPSGRELLPAEDAAHVQDRIYGFLPSPGPGLHAASVPAPGGGELLRLWEWEQPDDLPFHIDLWLPDGSDVLYAAVRVRNPHDRSVLVDGWPDAAVPGGGDPVRNPVGKRSRLQSGAEISWLEAYGPSAAEASLDAVHEAWLPVADTEPKESLATGSGWGALEVERGRFRLPGTPFAPSTLGEEQKPWLGLLLAGIFPRPPRNAPPGRPLVSPQWRELLETADTYSGNEWYLEYYLGLAQWHAGDRAQAIRSWERSAARHPGWAALRALAFADQESGNAARATERYLAAIADAERAPHAEILTALRREAAAVTPSLSRRS
ncbi:tetratricopeptide repeat protein [Actinacidiphila oryziradicis]|uniref:DUF5107 domain-containing protein n=1 Tax=Actinacidiphila oryziradicis TaxID=2571141 RepID=A0A4V5N0J4_9ACTN|nr:hypothetical protein [Actinacidiphila oryziradicis]TKA12179.1 hypothetical protein FCI23_07770 [Actinacidiphila oryziradicis]